MMGALLALGAGVVLLGGDDEPTSTSADVPRLELSDEERRALFDEDLPVVCRMCPTGEENLRIPGQFLCEEHALEAWGEEDLRDVLESVEGWEP